MKHLSWCACFLLFILSSSRAFAVITIDGRFDEPEWSGAEVFTDFRVIEPFTLGLPRHPTEVRLLGTPQGIAIAFRCTHPPRTPRQKQQTPRDSSNDGDRINIYIDLDADGRIAYNATISLAGSLQDATYTNENEYDSDWDGDIAYAVVDAEDEWYVEVLLPWTIAPRKDPNSPSRMIGVAFDRVIAATEERSMLAGLSYDLPRFLSEFPQVQIEQYRSSLVHVFPYASAATDLLTDHNTTEFGADILWKPSGRFQLTATLNPDFGQIEADELVVNFDAIEVEFSDKRPFFAENQAVFDAQIGTEGDQILYTRRIGGERDDDEDLVADIDAAVKLNGTVGGLEYGFLSAVEDQYDEDIGSAFAAQRLRYDADNWTLGYLGTWRERPYLDRNATVHTTDIIWTPSDSVYVQANLLVSDIDEAGEKTTGDGQVLSLYVTPDSNWDHELTFQHYSDDLDFNDLGFQERASMRTVSYSATLYNSDFDEDDRRGDVEWEFFPEFRWNDQGVELGHYLGIFRDAQTRAGANIYTHFEATGSGFDDLISRGNGNAKMEPRLGGFTQGYSSPRFGKWRASFDGTILQEGNEDYAFQLWSYLEFFARDNLTMTMELSRLWSRDWLIWEDDNLLASYHRDEVFLGGELDWFPAPNHELRIKLQWLAINAYEPRPFLIDELSGDLIASDDEVDPFFVNSLGLQVRYRWTFAPQSDLFVVYGRGGFFDDLGTESINNLFSKAFDLRDSDQFVVKVRYRFGTSGATRGRRSQSRTFASVAGAQERTGSQFLSD